MYYVYALKHPQTSFLYIGYTDNLIRRTQQHKRERPGWRLVYYEAYGSAKDARVRELHLKQHGSSLGHLRRRITHSLRQD